MTLHLNYLLLKTKDGIFYNYVKQCLNNNEIPAKDSLYIRRNFMYPSDISMYYYSFLIACILYKQYEKDPEKAFSNLKYIINNITPKNEKEILKAVDANPQDLDKLDNYIKRLRQNKS